jgi:hypothetical protein
VEVTPQMGETGYAARARRAGFQRLARRNAPAHQGNQADAQPALRRAAPGLDAGDGVIVREQKEAGSSLPQSWTL